MKFVNKVVDIANLKNINQNKTLKLKMMQAGIKGENSVSIYLFGKLVLPMLSGFVSFAVLKGGAIFEEQWSQ